MFFSVSNSPQNDTKLKKLWPVHLKIRPGKYGHFTSFREFSKISQGQGFSRDILNSITFFYFKVPWDDVAISGSLTGQNNSNWSSEQLFVGVMYADCTAGLASSNKTDYFHYFMLLYANTRPKTNLATTSRTKYHICERVEIFQESTSELMMDDTSNWLCSLSTTKYFHTKIFLNQIPDLSLAALLWVFLFQARQMESLAVEQNIAWLQSRVVAVGSVSVVTIVRITPISGFAS